MICGFTYYQICWYFLQYSFLGWVVEVLFHAITQGKIINRGFLNGPICPIYGFGSLSVLMLAQVLDSNGGQLTEVSSSLDNLALFIGGSIIATIIELFGGWILDTLFHTRWWNYSNKPLNFKGYICPEFSILWGLGILFCVRIVQPLMSASSGVLIAENIGWWILLVLYVILLVDLIVTVMTINGLNKNLAEIEKTRAAMRKLSDAITEGIAEPAIITSQHVEEQQIQGALARADLKDKTVTMASEVKEKLVIDNAERKARLDEMQKNKQEQIKNMLQAKHGKGIQRIFKAFPQLEQHQYFEAMQDLKEGIKKK